MSYDPSSAHITGLSYVDWEQDTDFIERAASQSERTGFLDVQHIQHAGQIEAALADELHVVDDVRALSDPQTAMELGEIRTKLETMRERVARALRRMRRLSARSRQVSH